MTVKLNDTFYPFFYTIFYYKLIRQEYPLHCPVHLELYQTGVTPPLPSAPGSLSHRSYPSTAQCTWQFTRQELPLHCPVHLAVYPTGVTPPLPSAPGSLSGRSYPSTAQCTQHFIRQELPLHCPVPPAFHTVLLSTAGMLDTQSTSAHNAGNPPD